MSTPAARALAANASADCGAGGGGRAAPEEGVGAGPRPAGGVQGRGEGLAGGVARPSSSCQHAGKFLLPAPHVHPSLHRYRSPSQLQALQAQQQPSLPTAHPPRGRRTPSCRPARRGACGWGRPASRAARARCEQHGRRRGAGRAVGACRRQRAAAARAGPAQRWRMTWVQHAARGMLHSASTARPPARPVHLADLGARDAVERGGGVQACVLRGRQRQRAAHAARSGAVGWRLVGSAAALLSSAPSSCRFCPLQMVPAAVTAAMPDASPRPRLRPRPTTRTRSRCSRPWARPRPAGAPPPA